MGSAKRRVQLIARDNGAGLSRDLRLLEGILKNFGYRVVVLRLGHHGRLSHRLRRLGVRAWRLVAGWCCGKPNGRFDLNLMIEQVRVEYLGQAHRNVLLPHPEWFNQASRDALPGIDRVLAKTRHAERLFRALGCDTEWVGFLGADHRRVGEQHRRREFLHAPGVSNNKGSDRLLALWDRHPEWPRLNLVWRRKQESAPVVPANVNWLTHYVAQDELLTLQNDTLFHLCPSQTEGYGHYLAESVSTGNVVITTDAEPMNELVTAGRGLLVAAHAVGTQDLATLFDFDEAAMEAAIERCIAMDDAEAMRLGTAARAWYDDNRTGFLKRFRHALDRVMADLP
jgi:glycosyltransferase involved in cell wall biosynthesis